MEKYRYINQAKFINHFFVQYVCTFRARRKYLRARYAQAYEPSRNFLRPQINTGPGTGFQANFLFFDKNFSFVI